MENLYNALPTHAAWYRSHSAHITHTVHYLLTRHPSRTQTTHTDHQREGKKQPAEADHPRLLHFDSET